MPVTAIFAGSHVNIGNGTSEMRNAGLLATRGRACAFDEETTTAAVYYPPTANTFPSLELHARLSGCLSFGSPSRKSAAERAGFPGAINYINRSLYKRAPRHRGRPRLQTRSFTCTRSLFDAKVLRAFTSAKGIGPAVLRLSQVPSRDADRAKLCR